MGFGRKGLAPGEAAPAPGGGFGRAAPAAAPGVAAVATNPEHDEIAAKREAFLAQERARQAEAQDAALAADAADPLANLRNSSRPQASPAQPLGMGVASAPAGSSIGAGGMSAAQEAEIRQAARSMAGRAAAPRAGGSGGSGFFFGEPSHRNLGMAYVLWFFLSQFSAHRFYCGQKDTAFMQMAMWFVSLVMLFIFPLFGLWGLGLWFCWIIGDLFMIPGMLKKFQAEHNYAGVFT